jgi:two-component system cell cycle response regulator
MTDDAPFDTGNTTVMQVLSMSDGASPRVLIVDDDELLLEQLRDLVVAAGFEVDTAPDGASALRTLETQFSAIVIMDRKMPGMDGLALCRAIRHQQWPGYIYILLLTAQDAEADILAGLDAGADDYLGKRTSRAQLVARLRTAKRILTLEHSLKQAVAEKHRLSMTDPLTGAANRRYFLKHLTREIKRVHRSQTPLALLSLDIDHFKRINDRYGHAAGDAVLSEFVQRINRGLRRGTDWCARLGGEEFAVILADTSGAGAQLVAEQIRAAVAQHAMVTEAGRIPITVSIGIASWERGEAPPVLETLMQQADQALYASKTHGRNRVTRANVYDRARSSSRD